MQGIQFFLMILILENKQVFSEKGILWVTFLICVRKDILGRTSYKNNFQIHVY